MKMKTVTVTLKLRVVDDQPVEDWLPEAVRALFDQEGEELLDYTDDEPDVPVEVARAEAKVDALLERARTRRFWKIDRGATT